MPGKLKLASLFAVVCYAQPLGAAGPVYKLLYSPPLGSNLGVFNDIFEVKPGLFTVLSAWTGGATGGSIFTISAAGTVTPIYSFPVQTTVGWIVQATNGKLYSSAYNGIPPNSTNFYFSMDPSGKSMEKYPFPSPWSPGFETTVSPPNEMFDLVAQITSNYPIWAFARVSEAGQITILHQFSASDGVPAYTRILLGPDGNLYGIGAQSPSGISPTFIYRFTPSGTYSRIYTYTSIPSYDAFPLVAASDGNLYGSFAKGGANNTGEIYKVTLSGQYQAMASFPPAISSPRDLMQAADGNLYGTTVYNTIFRYNLATHAVTLVYQMDVAGSQGSCGPCMLVEGTDGKLYGAAMNGGNYPGMGAVFSLNIGLPKPPPAVAGLYPASGAVGQKVVLWGKYLLGATSVSFNGVPASSVAVTSVQSVHATVPAGATTGPVTITTPNGSFTTTSSFTVQ